MRIILGSSSPRRAEILRSVVSQFDVIAPNIDERAFRQTSPSARTSAIAIAKGRAVASMITDDAVIITADTVVRMADGSIREKPSSEQEARNWLRSYRRTPPMCVTAVYALRTVDGCDLLAVDSAGVDFKPFTEAQIDAIIADGTVMNCAGAFTMEHPLMVPHVQSVWGNSETIQGLPSVLVRAHLRVLR